MKRRDFLGAAAGFEFVAMNVAAEQASPGGVGRREGNAPSSVEIPPDDAERRLGLKVVDATRAPGSPERYGAAADCAGTSPSELVAATDSTVGIQSAIDYAIYGYGYRRVELSGGGYKTSDTIHLGYGEKVFEAVVLEGQGYKYRGDRTMAGTAIIATKTDRPAINVQGGRGSVLRGVALVGALRPHVMRQRLCDADRAPLSDDTALDSWDARELGGARCDSRYSPYAGITVDAYSGARPPDPYPPVPYPRFLGDVAQYGKLYTSDFRVEDCYIGGFTVALANQPCDADGNGDYTTLSRVFIDSCKWGISVGNTQSRNLSLRDVKITHVHTVLTNRRHGRRVGKFGGSITDLSIYGAIRVFDFGATYAEPIHFVNFYAEALWRLGDLIPNTSEGSLIFSAALVGFHLQTSYRGHPADILKGSTVPAEVQFQGCTFSEYLSVLHFNTAGVSFEGCYFYFEHPRASEYERLAHNALAGGCVVHGLETPARSRIKSKYFHLASGRRTDVPALTGVWSVSDRDHCIPFLCERVRPSSEQSGDQFPPFAGGNVDKSQLTSVALRERTLTIVFASLSNEEALQNGPNPGDVMLDDRSGSVFFVQAREGTRVTARLQNNFRIDRGGTTILLQPFVPRQGVLRWRNARLYMPPRVLIGDVRAGSPALEVHGPGPRLTRWIDGAIARGDAVLVRPEDDDLTVSGATVITVNPERGTITLSESVPANRGSRRRFPFFVRQPPPNA